MSYKPLPGVCIGCRQWVPDKPRHYATHVCAALDFALLPDFDWQRSERATASRPLAERRPKQRPDWIPCSRCTGGPRVPGTSYCRPCRRLVLAESAARCRARRAGGVSRDGL